MATKLKLIGTIMPQKWNSNAKPAEKLLAVYTTLLLSGRAISLTELSKQLECSKQTVARLITQLEAAKFGKLLSCKQGKESVYRLERPKNLPKLSLNAEGLQHLALCKDFLLHLLPATVRETITTTLEQASAYLPDGAPRPATSATGESISKGRIDYSAHEQTFRTIVQAIEQQKVCVVGYKQALHHAPKQFEFAPKRLVAYREAFHIHGWTVSEKGTAQPLFETPTTLALHRLQSVTLSRRKTGHLPDVQDAHTGNFGVMDGEPFTVRVKFSCNAATYVAERIWSDDQKITMNKDGSLTLSMSARSDYELISWVLSFGDAAELLSPKGLREKLAGQVQRLGARYAGRGKDR